MVHRVPICTTLLCGALGGLIVIGAFPGQSQSRAANMQVVHPNPFLGFSSHFC